MRKVKSELADLGPEAPVEDLRTTRRREALRRRRTGLMFQIDRLERRHVSGRSKAADAPGFRYGVRSMLQGGSPGLGKRSN